MANFSIPIALNTNPIEKPVMLLANNLAVPVQLAPGLVIRPIELGFPEEPKLSELDFTLDSPLT